MQIGEGGIANDCRVGVAAPSEFSQHTARFLPGLNFTFQPTNSLFAKWHGLGECARFHTGIDRASFNRVTQTPTEERGGPALSQREPIALPARAADRQSAARERMSRSGHFPGNFVELDGNLLGTTQFASAESSENATFERCGVIARLHVAFFEAIAPENVAAPEYKMTSAPSVAPDRRIQS